MDIKKSMRLVVLGVGVLALGACGEQKDTSGSVTATQTKEVVKADSNFQPFSYYSGVDTLADAEGIEYNADVADSKSSLYLEGEVKSKTFQNVLNSDLFAPDNEDTLALATYIAKGIEAGASSINITDFYSLYHTDDTNVELEDNLFTVLELVFSLTSPYSGLVNEIKSESKDKEYVLNLEYVVPPEDIKEGILKVDEEVDKYSELAYKEIKAITDLDINNADSVLVYPKLQALFQEEQSKKDLEEYTVPYQNSGGVFMFANYKTDDIVQNRVSSSAMVIQALFNLQEQGQLSMDMVDLVLGASVDYEEHFEKLTSADTGYLWVLEVIDNQDVLSEDGSKAYFYPLILTGEQEKALQKEVEHTEYKGVTYYESSSYSKYVETLEEGNE